MIETLEKTKELADKLHQDDSATVREKVLAMDLFVASSRLIKELETNIKFKEMRFSNVGTEVSFE